MSDPPRPDPGSMQALTAGVGKWVRDRLTARAFRAGGGDPPGGAVPGATTPGPAAQAGREDTFRFPEMSLLWPAGQASAATVSATLAEQTVTDLELPHLIARIAPRQRYTPLLDRVLRSPLTDEASIRHRQGILADIRSSVVLRDCCAQLAEEAVASSESFRISTDERPMLFVVTMRLAELQDFGDSVDALLEALDASPRLSSAALLGLREALRALAATERYRSMRVAVRRMLADLRDIRSVTIGLNLDSLLRPVEATLLSINRHRFGASRLVASIRGRTGDEPRRGIADLHSMLAQHPQDATPIATPLFRDLAAILEQLARDLDKELRGFADARVDAVASLKQELVFYASAVNLAERLEAAGLPISLPEIRPREERVTRLRDAYNVNLALRMLERGAPVAESLVRNDADLGDPFRIAVLTGPNNGGKSVFLQAVGLAQVLAQTGMHVPAASAELSVADAVWTHYQIEERPDKEVGRLHEEAARLREVLGTVTRHSLLLSSETFSSTGSAEAAYLLLDVVRVLQRLGARAIFSTHLHELADAVERDEAFRSGETRVANLVALFSADAGEGRPTFHIVRTSPKGRSYAEGIARSLGIQYEQLLSMLESSGRLGKEPDSAS